MVQLTQTPRSPVLPPRSPPHASFQYQQRQRQRHRAKTRKQHKRPTSAHGVVDELYHRSADRAKHASHQVELDFSSTPQRDQTGQSWLTDAETAPPFPGTRSCPYTVASELIFPPATPTRKLKISTAARCVRVWRHQPRAMQPIPNRL